MPDFSNPTIFFLATLIMFLVVVGRYFLIAGFFHFGFICTERKMEEQKIKR